MGVLPGVRVEPWASGTFFAASLEESELAGWGSIDQCISKDKKNLHFFLILVFCVPGRLFH